MSRINYRKIWKNHYGSIPKDENNRTYEIHHKDSNKSNNDIFNLQCMSIQDHYDIHYSQGDYGACLLISRSMDILPEEKSHLAILVNEERIKNGTHNFLNNTYSRDHPAWNKGLTKQDHPGILSQSHKISIALKGKPKSLEHIKHNSESQKGCKHTEEHIQNAVNGRKAIWQLIDPDGRIYITRNRNQFAKDHNLKDPHLSHVTSGKLKDYNGWKCQRLQ